MYVFIALNFKGAKRKLQGDISACSNNINITVIANVLGASTLAGDGACGESSLGGVTTMRQRICAFPL